MLAPMRETEGPRAAALREVSAKAVIALPARRDCADQDAVANLVPSDTHTEFVNDPHGFVANDQTGLHGVLSI